MISLHPRVRKRGGGIVAPSAVVGSVYGWSQRWRQQIKFRPLTMLYSRYSSIKGEFNRFLSFWEYVPHHRVDRVLCFFASRPNRDPPTPSTGGECVPPPPPVRGGHSRLQEREWGVPIRTRGQTLCYTRYIRMYFVVRTFSVREVIYPIMCKEHMISRLSILYRRFPLDMRDCVNIS